MSYDYPEFYSEFGDEQVGFLKQSNLNTVFTCCKTTARHWRNVFLGRASQALCSHVRVVVFVVVIVEDPP